MKVFKLVDEVCLLAWFIFDWNLGKKSFDQVSDGLNLVHICLRILARNGLFHQRLEHA